MKRQLEQWLEGDRVAQAVLGCLWDGVVRRGEIAARVGVGVGAVTAARKRLERRMANWRRLKLAGVPCGTGAWQ